MRIIRHAALTPAPWRNGGGITHEIASVSDDCGLLWRLSLAEIDRNGPFSAFPGLHRILTVVAGGGLVLDLPDGPRRATRLCPVAFDGAVPVAAPDARGGQGTKSDVPEGCDRLGGDAFGRGAAPGCRRTGRNFRDSHRLRRRSGTEPLSNPATPCFAQERSTCRREARRSAFRSLTDLPGRRRRDRP